MAIFNTYLMIDWSANATPKRGANSIWYCLLERDGRGLQRRTLANPSTRRQARVEIVEILKDQSARQRRVLAGFDFPNGYPVGFAHAAGLAAGPEGRPWRAVWDGLNAMITDGHDNSNNRFEVAAELNRRISGGPFPFWGCPAQQQTDTLSMKKTHAYGEHMPERRHCETWLPRTQPCWKLYNTGSVGSQALMGIPVLKALRDDPEMAPQTLVWPFETGLGPPPGDRAPGTHVGDQPWRIILAEIYPSILAIKAKAGEIKDAVQVETLARQLAHRDESGELATDFGGPENLSETIRNLVEIEEGWILGAGTLSLK